MKSIDLVNCDKTINGHEWYTESFTRVGCKLCKATGVSVFDIGWYEANHTAEYKKRTLKNKASTEGNVE
jgi:hypothetical protein